MNNEKEIVISKNSFRWYGLGAWMIKYLIPISYIISRYGLFKESKRKIGGWAIVIVFLLVSAFKNKVKDYIKENEKHLGTTIKRIGPSIIFIALALLLWFSKTWLNGLIWLFVVLALSNALSILLYIPYDKKLEFYLKYKKIKEDSENDQLKKDIESGKIKFK